MSDESTRRELAAELFRIAESMHRSDPEQAETIYTARAYLLADAPLLASGPAPGAGEQRCTSCAGSKRAYVIRYAEDGTRTAGYEDCPTCATAPSDLEAKLREGEDLVAVSGTHARMEAWIAWALSAIRSLAAELTAAREECEQAKRKRVAAEKRADLLDESTQATLSRLRAELQAAKVAEQQRIGANLERLGIPRGVVLLDATTPLTPEMETYAARLAEERTAAQAQPPTRPCSGCGQMRHDNGVGPDCEATEIDQLQVPAGPKPEHATPWKIDDGPSAGEGMDVKIVSIPRASAVALCEDYADAEFIVYAANAAALNAAKGKP